MTEDGERFETADHLGGFLRGGDPDTTFPEMWAWLVETWEVKTVIDIGCGDGNALRHFRDLGCQVLGIEGVEQTDPDIVQFDFSTGAWDGRGPWKASAGFDLAW